jgi:hypothetical protein
MTTRDTDLALWLGRKVIVAQGSTTGEILLDDIAGRIADGADYQEAVNAVTAHDPHAGDFGVEIVGSMVAMAILEGLKVFWAAYITEVEKKAGKSLATATIDFVKDKFRKEMVGPERAAIETRMKNSIKNAAHRLKVSPNDLNSALDAIEPTISMSGGLRD